MWNEKSETRLRELWKDPKLNCSDMAAILGCGKNAVIGKAHRLGLESRRTAARMAPPKRSKPRSKSAFVFRPKPKRTVIYLPFAAPPIAPLSIPFIETESHHCRYPTHAEGDPAMCCGHTITLGSYCAYHNQVCHERPQKFREAA